MRCLFACALLLVLGCGDEGPEPGSTVVNISPVTGILDYGVGCSSDPFSTPPELSVPVGDRCEFSDEAPDVCQAFMDLPPGDCSLRIFVHDLETGEICVQHETLAIPERGEREFDVLLDDCVGLPIGFDG